MFFVCMQVLLTANLAVTSDCSCLRVWSLPCATTIATFNTRVSGEDTKDDTDTKYLSKNKDIVNTKNQINPKD